MAGAVACVDWAGKQGLAAEEHCRVFVCVRMPMRGGCRCNLDSACMESMKWQRQCYRQGCIDGTVSTRKGSLGQRGIGWLKGSMNRARG